MDLTTLQSETRGRTGVPDDDSLITDARLTSFVNTAVQMIAGGKDWPWLEESATITTIGAQDTYAVPADWQSTISVVSSTGVPLRRTPIDELDYQAGAGTPRFFGVFGDEVILRPTPSGAESLRHRYIKAAPAISSGSDVPVVPVGWHHVIVEYAAYLVFRRTGNLTEAGAALAQFKDWMVEMGRQADRWSDSQGGAMGTEPAKVKAQA